MPALASASSLYVGINGGTGGGEQQYAKRLDNFSAAVTIVPEPGTVALIALGGAVTLLLARRPSTPRA